jgi:hypothetical protein
MVAQNIDSPKAFSQKEDTVRKSVSKKRNGCRQITRATLKEHLP